jgi:hypothetical protein
VFFQAGAHGPRAGLVVDAGVKAQFLHHPLALGGTTGDADHAAAFDLGHLAHGLAHCTGRARHHHGLTGLGHAHIHQAEVAGHAGHAQHVEPLGQCAGPQINFGQTTALDLIGGYGDVLLHAEATTHIVAHGKCRILGGYHLANATGAHDFTDADGRDVALSFVHPAAHGWVQRKCQGLEGDATLCRLADGFGGVAPVAGFGQANGAGSKTNLVIDEVGDGHEGNSVMERWDAAGKRTAWEAHGSAPACAPALPRRQTPHGARA